MGEGPVLDWWFAGDGVLEYEHSGGRTLARVYKCGVWTACLADGTRVYKGESLRAALRTVESCVAHDLKVVA